MAELVILGSGSGFATQDRSCTSIALLVERSLYLLDCGEPCAANLFRNGIDALALKTLVVSHMHPDHVGGLAGLLSAIGLAARTGGRKFRPWSVNRNDPWYRAALTFPDRGLAGEPVPETRPHITVLLPSEAIAAIQVYLPAVYLNPAKLAFDLELRPVRQGPTYVDDLIAVTSVPNTHIAEARPAGERGAAGQSYSYAIEVQGTRLVFSGDITSPAELTPLLPGAQLLIIEMAHHDPDAFADFLMQTPIPQIVLTHIHPGLETRIRELVREWADPRVKVAYDGLRLPLAHPDHRPA